MRIFLVFISVISLFLIGCDVVVTPADNDNNDPVVIHDNIDINEPDNQDQVEPDGQDQSEPDANNEDSNGSDLATPEEAEQVHVSDVYWISDTGVVHNSLCRWYHKCSGKEWDGEEDHTNCQTCGGTEPIIRKWNLPDYKGK